MSDWQRLHNGDESHRAALSGRPLIVYGVPRYGPTAARRALCYFETGCGWREVPTDRKFDPTHWMPLPEPPVLP